MNTTGELTLNMLKEKFQVTEMRVESPNRVWARIAPDKILAIAKFLSNELEFDHLSSIAGADYGEALEAVYQITAYSHGIVLTLKAKVPKSNPVIDSLTPVYWNAAWYEREAYELLGISFRGNPNLAPLVLPAEMMGEYPLRKDYKGYPNPT
ncbi:MAG TPA: NADH-quinone oxidoreductase subunit C [Candidatus Methanoperedenaceae archaeon]|nr:NADH-quinone oxidoreductase subunit C [Candidatus Methanoperedenaceae archaeon]